MSRVTRPAGCCGWVAATGCVAAGADLAADDQAQVDRGRLRRLGLGGRLGGGFVGVPGGGSVEGDEARSSAHREGIDQELVELAPQRGDELLQARPAAGVGRQAGADDPLQRLGQPGASRVGVGQAPADLVLSRRSSARERRLRR